MKFATPILSTVFLLISSVWADANYFQKPDPNRTYRPGSTITFLVDDMPDTDGHRVYANLYRDGGNFVHTIDAWDATTVDDDQDHFEFNWPVSGNLDEGRYFVQIDIDNEDHDDPCRSYAFHVVDTITDAYANDDHVPQRSKRSRTEFSQLLRNKIVKK